jgi:hypothetical protein
MYPSEYERNVLIKIKNIMNKYVGVVTDYRESINVVIYLGVYAGFYF